MLRPTIAKSWKRCAEYGLDPYLLRVVHPIKDAGVLKKENKELIAVYRPFMELVYNIVRALDWLNRC